jgi:hypothetical protein
MLNNAVMLGWAMELEANLKTQATQQPSRDT